MRTLVKFVEALPGAILAHPTALAIIGGIILAIGGYAAGWHRGRRDQAAADKLAMSELYRNGYNDAAQAGVVLVPQFDGPEGTPYVDLQITR